MTISYVYDIYSQFSFQYITVWSLIISHFSYDVYLGSKQSS